MKNFLIVLTLTILCFGAYGKETTFTGSTPVHRSVRQFLNIPLNDSIDFIRWKLVFDNEKKS